MGAVRSSETSEHSSIHYTAQKRKRGHKLISNRCENLQTNIYMLKAAEWRQLEIDKPVGPPPPAQLITSRDINTNRF